jgi:Prokaryotic N-terminal methylation motif
MFVESRESRVESQKNCGLRHPGGTWDCGLKHPNPNSEIRNPKSPHRGLSLTEVLIAMGILTMGLLGVAIVFPVGSFYMQKAEISDRGSAIAQSVMNDLMARGMLNPRAWFVAVPIPTPSNPSAPAAITSPNEVFTGIDGRYAPVPQPDNGNKTASTFTRPFAEALSEGLKRNTDVAILAKQFGHAFVIDPMFAAAAANNAVNNLNVAAYPFPATAYAKYPWPTSTYYGTRGWNPWRAASKSSGEKTWPIRRVTFRQTTGWPLDKTMASSYFRGDDDLATDLPARDDRPAKQIWEISTTGTPLARQ